MRTTTTTQTQRYLTALGILFNLYPENMTFITRVATKLVLTHPQDSAGRSSICLLSRVRQNTTARGFYCPCAVLLYFTGLAKKVTLVRDIQIGLPFVSSSAVLPH